MSVVTWTGSNVTPFKLHKLFGGVPPIPGVFCGTVQGVGANIKKIFLTSTNNVDCDVETSHETAVSSHETAVRSRGGALQSWPEIGAGSAHLFSSFFSSTHLIVMDPKHHTFKLNMQEKKN